MLVACFFLSKALHLIKDTNFPSHLMSCLDISFRATETYQDRLTWEVHWLRPWHGPESRAGSDSGTAPSVVILCTFGAV